MNLVLVPYVKMNEEWSLTEPVLRWVWGSMVAEDLVNKVFFSGSVTNEDEFVEFCQRPDIGLHFIFTENGDLGAMGWISEYDMHHAHAHYCTFSAIKGNADAAGRMSLRHWFYLSENGKPLLKVLIGIFPEANRGIDRFVRRMGFTVLGVIPSLIYNAKDNCMTGAVLSYLERRQ